MLPWEHAAVGYLAYSLFSHLRYRRAPGGVETIAVIVGAQFPDLIDKPLAWQFGVFDSGYALGHSVFLALPAAAVAAALARTRDRFVAAGAFAVGYLLHLPGDVVPGYLQSGELHLEIVLWPVRTATPGQYDTPAVARTLAIFEEYVRTLTSQDPPTLVLVQAGVVALTGLLWLYDGAPVLRELVVGTRDLLSKTPRNAAD
jgi:hypothetical protein